MDFHRNGVLLKEEYIALPADVRNEIDEYKRWCGRIDSDDFTFPSRRKTPINSNNWLNRVLKPAANEAGVEHIGYHMLRRGLATDLDEATNGDLKSVQHQLRHKNRSTTDRYIKKLKGRDDKRISEGS